MQENASALKSEEHVHALFVGPSGCGKTCASVTVGDTEEKSSRVHVFDCDTRIKGILGTSILKEKIASGAITFSQYATEKDPLDAMERDIDAVHAKVLKKEIDTVVLSSTTSLNFLGESAALACNDIKHNIIRGRKLTQVQDYGYIARVDKDLILDELKTWPCNLIVETHLKDDGHNDADGNFVVVGKTFNLPGQLATLVPTWFDETYEFFVDDMVISNPKYKVKFRGKLAKTSFPGLPTELEWTGRNFFKLITAIKNGELDQRGNSKVSVGAAPTVGGKPLTGLAALAALKK